MRYIVMPIEDAKAVFSEKELETMRKNVAGTKVIVHEETLLHKREAMGMSMLPSEETGQIEWTYPVYLSNDVALTELLASSAWHCDTEGGVTP